MPEIHQMALTWGGRWRGIKVVTNMGHAEGGERHTALYFKRLLHSSALKVVTCQTLKDEGPTECMTKFQPTPSCSISGWFQQSLEMGLERLTLVRRLEGSNLETFKKIVTI